MLYARRWTPMPAARHRLSNGIVIEGENPTCVLSGGGSPSPPANCYVSKISGGVPTVVLGYGGSGYIVCPQLYGV
jgi:hypothetical protein